MIPQKQETAVQQQVVVEVPIEQAFQIFIEKEHSVWRRKCRGAVPPLRDYVRNDARLCRAILRDHRREKSGPFEAANLG